ncbi:TIGR02587 family membrane protein [Sphingosinicella humi]|nr:TIGR02587 family membrane protein [Sphingosinicella humi]
MASQVGVDAKDANRDYAVGLARAFGGAIIFGLPMLMTMEMWFLGFYIERERLLLFLVLNLLMLVGLSRFGGFERTESSFDDILDAFAAYAVGVIASAAVLFIFGILTTDMPWTEIVGKIVVQSVPASFGAIIARKQLSGGAEERDDEEEEQEALEQASYGGELFLMAAGALFLAFNMAPTEEMILIGFKMSPWHGMALVLFSILLLHGFVYGVGFAGQEQSPEGKGFRARFLGYTIAGYGIALLVSLYVLWTFGRTDGVNLSQIATMTAVLGFPASVGAAIARLVV